MTVAKPSESFSEEGALKSQRTCQQPTPVTSSLEPQTITPQRPLPLETFGEEHLHRDELADDPDRPGWRARKLEGFHRLHDLHRMRTVYGQGGPCQGRRARAVLTRTIST